MRSKVVRAGAALFMVTAAFVPAHLAAASSGSGNENTPGFQCPADQALFDQIKAWIVEFGPLLGDPSQADPSLQGQIELLASLALLSDADLCLTLTGSNGGGGEDTTTTTSDDDDDTIEICHATGNPNHPYVEITVNVNGLNGHGDDSDDLIPAPEDGCPGPTTSTTGETTSTTAEETTSTTAEETTSTTEAPTTSTTGETTSTTAEETTTTTAPTTTTTAPTTTTTAATTSTTAAATTSTTAAATTSTTGATTTTAAHSTTEPTVGGVVVTSAGTLPRTGSEPAPLVALGSLTAGLGFLLLVVRRRFVS